MTGMRIVQITANTGARRVATVDGDTLTLIKGVATTVELAGRAIAEKKSLAAVVSSLGTDGSESYDEVVGSGRLLSPADHPEPSRCHVTGTGLTHLGSAEGRAEMHAKLASADLTDSMKMFKMGLEGGKPSGGTVGVQPEWFYKGNGSTVVAPGKPLARPAFASDGGDEAEICGVYVIGSDGLPYRLGFALGNEFSDHVMERVNYLYLAHSKLRDSSFGPELLLGDLPASVTGTSRVVRGSNPVWEKPFLSGEDHMTHTIANLEAHQFKYPFFRRPGDVHIHYFGTGTFSFKDGVKLEDGDVMEIASPVFGHPLRNPIRFTPDTFVPVKAL